MKYWEKRIVDGLSTSIWFDPWLEGGRIINRLGFEALERMRGENLLVADILEEGLWKPYKFSFTFPFKNEIENIRIFTNHQHDFWVWLLTPNGQYSFASAWDSLRTKYGTVEWFTLVWDKAHCPKMSFCLYKAISDLLPTKNRLLQRHMLVDPVCVLWNKDEESAQHLFFKCSYSTYVWKWCRVKLLIPAGHTDILCLQQELKIISDQFTSKTLVRDLAKIVLSITVWSLWKERNNRIFNQKSIHQRKLCDIITSYAIIIISKSRKNNNSSSSRDNRVLQEWGVEPFT